MEDQTNPHASSSTLPSLFRGLGELRINSLSAEESASSSSEAVFLSDGADCVVFTANDLFQSAFPAMSEMRRDGKLCDVTVKVGGTHFNVRAHKVVLAATIPYFRAMFEHEGFGSVLLNSWLKEMQKNKMLRLFGIAENDSGNLFVSEHARQNNK